MYILGTLSVIVIYILKMIDINRDMYMCFFFYYTGAFDKVRHKEIIRPLRTMNVYRRDPSIVENMYWQQEVANKKRSVESFPTH